MVRLLGPNGAGKTTTLRIMTGLARATSGTVTIEGVRVGGPHRPPIGYLPDTPSFYNWMTAPEFLRYIADLHGLADPPITALLERVGLGDTGRRTIGGFSRGMKQRLGLAQALLPSPPFCCSTSQPSALDPAGRREVLDIMSESARRADHLLSTHILNDAERISAKRGRHPAPGRATAPGAARGAAGPFRAADLRDRCDAG